MRDDARAMELRGRKVLLTGAAGGIGAHIAQALADEGADLALSGRDESRLDALRDRLRAAGTRCETVTADLADPGQVDSLADRAEQALGSIDVLVNNAGLDTAGFFSEMSPEEIERATRVNLLAPMLLTRRLLPGMLERGAGHVIQISSLAGKLGAPYVQPYSATKFGLVGFTQALRLEYADAPVGFSVVCPGFISDAGMYARAATESGASAPSTVGTAPPEKVARAVVRAIKRDLPEVIVNSRPVKPLLALSAISPRLGEGMSRRIGVREMFRAWAETLGPR
jgi:short-subunit dehydrogenase